MNGYNVLSYKTPTHECTINVRKYQQIVCDTAGVKILTTEISHEYHYSDVTCEKFDDL